MGRVEGRVRHMIRYNGPSDAYHVVKAIIQPRGAPQRHGMRPEDLRADRDRGRGRRWRFVRRQRCSRRCFRCWPKVVAPAARAPGAEILVAGHLVERRPTDRSP